jgi:hypothetical protein
MSSFSTVLTSLVVPCLASLSTLSHVLHVWFSQVSAMIILYNKQFQTSDFQQAVFISYLCSWVCVLALAILGSAGIDSWLWEVHPNHMAKG